MKGHISVQSLSKSYFSYGRELKRVLSWIGLPFKPVSKTDVLKNISFQIGAGESVAIIGQNGAGKSTILKILCGTTTANSGSFKIDGKIAAILELGMGFNTEFSARENAFHAATLMGYTKQEIDYVMPKIKEFAEIGDYFEQPMRTYSSGMQMRVAFAVATAYRPDFLIVDEALAVGDVYFQHKSYAKIKEFKSLGTTILFVSHDRNAIVNICERSLLLRNGGLLFDGPTGEALDLYNSLLAIKEDDSQKTFKNSKVSVGGSTKSGTGEATFQKVTLLSELSVETQCIKIGEHVKIEIEIRANENVNNLVVGYSIRDKYGQIMFGTNSSLLGRPLKPLKIGHTQKVYFSFKNNLGIGTYYLTVALHGGETHIDGNYAWIDKCCNFEVIGNGDRFQGCLYLQNDLDVID